MEVPWDKKYLIMKTVLLAVSEAVLSHNEERNRSALYNNLCAAPRCSRGLYKREEQLSCAEYHPFCSSLSQRQSHPIKTWGADPLFSLSSVLFLAVPDVVLSVT